MPVEVQKEDFTKKYSVKKPVTFDSPPEEKKISSQGKTSLPPVWVFPALNSLMTETVRISLPLSENRERRQGTGVKI